MIWTLEPDYHLWAHLAWILEPPRAGGEAVGPSRGGCSAPTHSQRGREASACQEVVTAACRKDVHLLCLSKKAIPTSSAGEAVARCRDPCPKQASCGMDNGNLQDEWTSQKRWGEADRRYWRKTQEKGIGAWLEQFRRRCFVPLLLVRLVEQKQPGSQVPTSDIPLSFGLEE
ncbi:uncharacterized protein LOC135995844 isoform X4 [Caloenas nicobarica]|uniref:uncharacterized protein LOC135995844 isoform X4 n=1 Tax=Caloenas nicobarica TaxID=187106 RepID=UPI0032B8429E